MDSDPTRQLSALLGEHSLEHRFQNALLSAFRRIQDHDYFPAGDFPREIQRVGGVEFAKRWLRDERAEVVLEALEYRVDLSVQWYVERWPYFNLFDDTDHELAQLHLNRVRSVAYLRHLGVKHPLPDDEAGRAQLAIANLTQDRFYDLGDLVALQRRRAIRSWDLPFPEKIALLEQELADGHPFTSDQDILDHVLALSSQAAPKTEVAESVRELVNCLPSLLGRELEILRPTFDFSAQKVATVARLTGATMEDAGNFLNVRVALVCARIGDYIHRLNEAYFSTGMPFSFFQDRGLFSYFDPQDACLLRAACFVSATLPMTATTAEITSFQDLPESEILPFREFDSNSNHSLLDYNLDLYVNVEVFVRFALHLAGSVSTSKESPRLPALRVASKAVEESLTAERNAQAYVFLMGQDRREQSERGARQRLGSRLDRLIPEARANLICAEYVLLDRFHPIPSHAILTIATAFELEVKDILLRFEKESGREFTLKKKPLGQLLSAFEKQDPFITDAMTQYRIDASAVAKCIRELLDIRNRATHVGDLSFDVSVGYRDRLLGALDIFGHIFPNS